MFSLAIAPPSALADFVSGTLLPAVLAQTTRPAGPAAPWYVELTRTPMFPVIALLVVFYTFMITSKRKQDRQKKDLLDNVKRGDRVQTIGGILGNVVEAKPEKVLVKVDESSNTKIWFARSAIAKVLGDEKSEAK